MTQDVPAGTGAGGGVDAGDRFEWVSAKLCSERAEEATLSSTLLGTARLVRASVKSICRGGSEVHDSELHGTTVLVQPFVQQV
jgi:hypothetical protein